MRFSDIRDLDRDDVTDFVWKWRCKILPRSDMPLSKPLDLESLDDNETKVAVVPGKDAAFGSEAAIKTMYEGRNSSASHYEWVDYPPKQLSKSAARAQDRVAIKVYKAKDRDKVCIGGRFPLKYHTIEIQNHQLVAALEPILKKENVLLDVNETAELAYPFRALWFCQDDIADLYKRTATTDPLKGYTQLLSRVMNDMFSDMRIKHKHLQASGLVDFKTAWTLFPRGSTVYSYGVNSEFCAKVESTRYAMKCDRKYLFVDTKILAFNGEEFVWQNKVLPISEFEGNKPVSELEHYPIEFHPDAADITRRLTARGKKVLDLQGLQYCCYNGIVLHMTENDVERHNVESRVLIDVVGYNKYHLAKGKRENKDPETERNFARRRGRRVPPRDNEDDEDEESSNRGSKRLSERDQLRNKEDMLTREDELKFMTELTGGYALKNKMWVQFYVEDLEPMVWNDKAYSHLVYDDQQKDLVMSFVESHSLRSQGSSRNKTAGPMEDVILGKGQGLIILLSGPPGTGKTLMAEAVADRTHRPLFYLQAEDLGINAAALGANVKKVFEMATEWDAVILLDEADVFMAERNPNDIHRNELVSIFLRELEYFRGIIFLTTNLYHTIDSAFRSRVSLHLLFQSLTKEARETVWRKFLQRMPQPNKTKAIKSDVETAEAEKDAAGDSNKSASDRPLDDDDIRELALWHLNGREIKNAVKMVRSWCDHKGYMMTLERVENGIKVTSPHASKDGDVDKDLYE